MNSIQIIAAFSLALAIVASLLCAARLHNWRHPILLVGLAALGLLPGALSDRTQARAQAKEYRPPSIEDLVHDRYIQLMGSHYEGTR